MDLGPISSCYAPLRSGWDVLYQEVCRVNALACATLLGAYIARPVSRQVGSSPYKRWGERRTHPLWDPARSPSFLFQVEGDVCIAGY